MSNVDIKYRREIDGLRAVAVLPVLMFHAGFSTFQGGYVGVDIFFVISGYLITSILLDHLDNGTFTLVGFYERRARRILPALFFVMLCSLPFAWFLLLPKAFIDFGQSIAAVSIFSSNVLFWAESGYFEAASELKPLLHTWSLGVEEQYYLVFPLFLMVVWRYARKHLLRVLILLAILSLAIAQWGVFYKPEAAFFLLPMRGWELAIGAIVAVFCSDNKPQFVSITSNKATNDFLGLAALLSHSFQSSAS